MWDKTGKLQGYDYDSLRVETGTIRSVPKPEPQPLSKKNTEKLKDSIRESEKTAK